MKLISSANTGVNAVIDRLKEIFSTAGYLPPNGAEALRGTLTTLVENSNELTERVPELEARVAALEVRQQNPFG